MMFSWIRFNKLNLIKGGEIMNLLKEGIEQKVVIKTESSKKLSIDNHTETYPIYKIRLDQLYYNEQNDRIATWMSQYKTENGTQGVVASDSEQYNAIIHDFITKSNPDAMKKTQNNIELLGQREAGVVLQNGKVIDGNRRFTCLRNIEKKEGETQYLEAVILPYSDETSRKEIKMLELLLQHGVDKPVDYDPIDRLIGIYNDIVDQQLLTVKEYAKSVNRKEKEIEEEVEKSKLMVEYLEFMNMKKQFHLVRNFNLDAPLKELLAILKKCSDEEVSDDLKNVVFANFTMQPVGDMTRYIRKIKKIANNPKMLDGYLEEQLPFTEQVLDKMETQTEITEAFVNEKIRSDVELGDSFARSTEKWIEKIDQNTSRNAAAHQAEKAYDILEVIDTKIFKKLSEEEKRTVRSKLLQIEEILESIRSDLEDV